MAQFEDRARGEDRSRGNARLLAAILVIVTTLWLALSAPAAALATQSAGPIEVFQSYSSFSAAARITRVSTFDEFQADTSLGNPVLVGKVVVHHSAAATFKPTAVPYVPVSSPNVLAPFKADNTLEFGTTSLTMRESTRVAGLYLVIPRGSNQDAIWTTTVTVTDVQQNSVVVTVAFRGVVGEQQFVGVKSRHKLASIIFDPATKPDASTVVAMDDIVVG